MSSVVLACVRRFFFNRRRSTYQKDISMVLTELQPPVTKISPKEPQICWLPSSNAARKHCLHSNLQHTADDFLQCMRGENHLNNDRTHQWCIQLSWVVRFSQFSALLVALLLAACAPPATEAAQANFAAEFNMSVSSLGVSGGGVVLHDMDADGSVDVVVSAQSTLSWYRNTGNGTFAPRIVLSSFWQEEFSFAFADLDRDGYLDVAYTNGAGIYVDSGVISPENLPRPYRPTVRLPTNADDLPRSISRYNILLVDLDNDGVLDILTAGTVNVRLGDDGFATPYLFRNYGNGSILYAGRATRSDQLDGPYRVVDVDGNGFADLVGRRRTMIPGQLAQWRAAWVPNFGNFTFGSISLVTADVGDEVTSVQVMDVDGDGLDDVVCCYDRSIWWHRKVTGTGDFSARINVDALADVGFRCDGLIGSDINGDGLADVIVHSRGSSVAVLNATALFLNRANQPGVFDFSFINTDRQEAAPSVGYLGERYFAVADVTGDGLADVLTLSKFRSALQRNLGGAQFVQQVLISEWATDYRGADVDGDGVLDVVGLVYGTSPYVWWARQAPSAFGILTFETPQVVWANGRDINRARFKQVEVADMDGDGSLDLIMQDTWHYGNEWFYWIPSMRDSSNREWQPLISGLNYEGYAAPRYQIVDMNGDGQLDVLAISPTGIVWFANLGNAVMGPSQMLIPAWNDYYTATYFSGADMNNDGFLDIVLIGKPFYSPPASSLWYYRNTGSVSYTHLTLPTNREV